ncbi:MAG: L-lysine 6-transaminase [Candidatus Heimdallarchaeota archaeon]|nr:L-lysine 6-transaminase [Candidatus Heimdallarchaeota archaeon]
MKKKSVGDKKDKKGGQYLDLYTFYASAPLGMNHPKITTKEFLEKLAKVAANKPANSESVTEELAEFVETFEQIALPKEFKYLFFISGGALAVENALKVAFDWKIRKNFAAGEERELGAQIIHFDKCFHGRSGYTLSLTNTFDPRKTKYFPKFDWPRVPAPTITFPLEDHLEEVKEQEKITLEKIEGAVADNPKDIAGLITEPIQGEGGDNHFRPEFLQALRKICDENDIMLIFDEVQTGVGLTGKMWAYEHFDMAPDIIAFGKKMQVCGIMSSTRVDEVEDNVFHESSRINSTWGGNLVDMVRSTKYLQIIAEDKLVENARKVGEYLLKGLQDLAEDACNISNARGRGLFCAFDLRSTKERDAVKKQLLKNKVLILGCGEQSIRFRPPLCLDKEHVDLALERFENSCKQVL